VRFFKNIYTSIVPSNKDKWTDTFHRKIQQTNLKVQPVGYRLEGPVFESIKGNKVFQVQIVQIDSGAYPASSSMSTGFFPAGKAAGALS